ncbi:sensor histidine kinase [Terrabacter sp. C0L_2]|uniref:sensor histidine kinase n=1 Tax=Terrabacter sp. C0L_2 TaxID=3108389 RepID=UPI002ED3A4DF|nr:HAMP domain-containing sensor histidine kinase [Terrabacter sp. C0L_2]
MSAARRARPATAAPPATDANVAAGPSPHPRSSRLRWLPGARRGGPRHRSTDEHRPSDGNEGNEGNASDPVVGDSDGVADSADNGGNGTSGNGQGRPLATRLLLAQGAVVAAGIITASVVAAVMGPPIFHEHLVRAGTSATGTEMAHVEEAFRDASLISLGIALVIALLCALVVTWFVTGRLQRPLASLTKTAAEMGRGRYSARAHVADAGPELSSLADAFNTMAAQLESTEDTRRRLLSDVAHEMRTPVATLSAYLEGLDDGVAEWGPETAALFRAHTDRLARLCDDIAMVSRAEEGQLHMGMVPARVGDVLEAAARGAAASFAAKEVALHVVHGSGWDVTVRADPERLGQVLSNLLSNALRHTPAEGRVTMTTSHSRGDETVSVLVVDTGEGITAEQLPHVFERFYRGDSARTRDDRGSGIGLTIAKAIVEAHGGVISVSSDGPGSGTSFSLTLPAPS